MAANAASAQRHRASEVPRACRYAGRRVASRKRCQTAAGTRPSARCGSASSSRASARGSSPAGGAPDAAPAAQPSRRASRRDIALLSAGEQCARGS
jgi:hypothetical protein